jgi:hypothetical protein
MKRYQIIAIALGMSSLVSCNKWLDVTPKTEMKAKVLFSNQAGFRDALMGIYTLMIGSSSYGSELTMASVDVLGQTYDNVRSTAGHNYENMSKYKYTDAVVEDKLNSIWRQQYKAIANANIILANIDEKKSVFASGNYNLIKGETLALRALFHFDLLRLFSPAPITGINKKAIPYVTAYTNVPFVQSTVSEVLDKVFKDLMDARELLKSVDAYGPDRVVIPEGEEGGLLKNRSYRMNYYAVCGLLARTYLYKGDKVNALLYAKEVIATDLFPMFELNRNNVPTVLSDYIFPTEQLFCLKVKGLKDGYANLNFPEVTLSNSPAALTINNSSVTQLFPVGTNTDYRNNWLDAATSNSKRITKYNFNDIIPMLKKSEMYLIAAECESVTATAVGYLNVLRAHRGLAVLDPVSTDRTKLDSEIGLEYRREFIAEGQLFYYYKRLNVAKIPAISQFADPDQVYTIPIPTAEIEFGNIN